MIIGLSGYARSGKDTAAAFLMAAGWRKASFAGALKDALYVLNPIIIGGDNPWRVQTIVDRDGWERAKDNYPEIRALLQRLGTDVGRNLFGDTFWVDIAMARLQGDPVSGEYWNTVFADCRFPNEAEAIKAAGGQVWRIERPGFAPVNAHPSETALDGYEFDRVIVNDGSLQSLRRLVLQVAA